MTEIISIAGKILTGNGLVMSFVFVGLVMAASGWMSKTLTRGRIHPSAVAVLLALLFAYVGGRLTGGSGGLSDLPVFSGLSLMGGAMLRDFTVIATAFGADPGAIKKCGPAGVAALLTGIVLSFAVGAFAAWSFGYRDAASVATIGAGTVTFIVGPVTGAAVGAAGDVIAISIAAGIVKSIVVMIVTPAAAKYVGLNSPKTAMIYGSLVGSTSGIGAGLAAVDADLIPYGVLTATFYSGLGCLLCPTVLYGCVKLILPN